MDLLHLYLRPGHTCRFALVDYKLVAKIAYAENVTVLSEKLIQLILGRLA